MIDVKKEKVNEVVQEIHEAMQRRKVKREKQIKEEIVAENRLFALLCKNAAMEPTKCAVTLNDKYGYDFTGDQIIQIFRHRRMSNPAERKALIQWADDVAELFAKAITGNKEAFEKYEKRRKEPALSNGKKHDSQERLAVLMIYEKYPEIDNFDDVSSLHFLGNTLAKYFFYDICDALCEVYGFPMHKDAKKKVQNVKPKKQMTLEQALRRIEQLENMLDRTNTMLEDLEDEFAEQLEESKAKELADFFARLNSERYGCILDELLVVRKGVDELRKSNYELPIEINGLLIMVKKLIQFVRDSHIEPMMKINSVKEVVASDVEFCNYEGTPFASPKEAKKVKVVSPGWIYKDKELQISRPKVKEIE